MKKQVQVNQTTQAQDTVSTQQAARQDTTIRYTPEQSSAINLEGSLIVSASAGSGKTTVMIERIVRLLLGGVDIDNIFITTFTKASATDMRQKLKKKLASTPTHTLGAETIEDIIDKIDVAPIGTFHSVCARLIRMHFYSCGVDPDFVLMDEVESDYRLCDSIARAIEYYNQNPTKDYLDLYTVFLSRRSDKALKELVRNIYLFAAAQIDSSAWLDNATINIADTSIVIDRLWQEARDRDITLIEGRIYDYIDRAKAIGMDINIYAQELLDVVAGRSDDSRLTVLSKKKVGLDDSRPEHLLLYESFKNFKSDTSSAYKKINSTVLVDSRLCLPLASAMIALTKNAMERYSAYKRRNALMDYSDIEHTMALVLRDSVASGLIKERIRYIFVDEYQDINPLQDSIISGLSEGAERFFVGDIKQSIYGFRMCDPRFFADKLASGDKTINLNGNFRSSREILQFVNDVFATSMSVDCGGVDYKNTAMLVGNTKSDIDSPVSINIVKQAAASEWGKRKFEAYDPIEHDDRYIDDTSNTAAEIDSVASHIGMLLGQGVPHRDIAVLVRNRGRFAIGLYERLQYIGVSAAIIQKTPITDNQETAALIAYLRIIDLPSDEISLIAVLLSEFYGFSPSDLATIKLAFDNKRMSFYQMCNDYIELDNCNQDISARLIQLRDNMILLDNYKQTHTVQDIASLVVAMHRYTLSLMATEGGDNRISALYQYIDKLGQDKHNNDLSRYVIALDELTDKVETVDACSDKIQIITAHASKGLEYDYLIVADTGMRFNNRDLIGKVILDSILGLGTKYFDIDSGETHINRVYECIKMRKTEQMISEEMRLCYVALTRAKKQIAVFGSTPSKKWIDRLESGQIEQATSWLDWIARVFDKYPVKWIESDFRLSDKPSLDIKRVYASKDERQIRHIVDLIGSTKYKYATGIKGQKTSVSRLISEYSLDYNNTVPKVSGAKKSMYSMLDIEQMQAAQKKGQLYHKVMQNIEFDIGYESAIERIEQDIDISTLDRGKIKRMYDAIASLAKGATIYRELDFVYNDDSNATVDTLVQGRIDLVILREGKATIVDYKTSVDKGSIDNAYQYQLSMYRRALQDILHIPVTRQTLYDIGKGKFVDIAIDV